MRGIVILIIGIVCIGLSILFYYKNNQIITTEKISYGYGDDHQEKCNENRCTIILKITEDIEKPVAFYYQI